MRINFVKPNILLINSINDWYNLDDIWTIVFEYEIDLDTETGKYDNIISIEKKKNISRKIGNQLMVNFVMCSVLFQL